MTAYRFFRGGTPFCCAYGMRFAKERVRMRTNCEECSNYCYDEDMEDYSCQIDLDEDEYSRYISDSSYECPYYRCSDDYRIVRKQM